MGSPTATRADVARLYGRAAFGATGPELDELTGQPYADVVSRLVDLPDRPVRVYLDEVKRTQLETNAEFNIDECERWWLERMRSGLFPLEERMTLFWHDHFATGYGPDPFARSMIRQNQTLRVNALGNYRPLCNAVTLDPAMLQYLSGTESYVSPGPGGTWNRHVNENYGREFFELFTLGVNPQVYTEADMKESARALTGWIAYSSDSVQGANAVQFNLNRHDRGVKNVLGTAIGGPATDEPNEYKRITDVALAQPVASRHLAWKLVAHFGYVPAVTNLLDDTDPLITKVAASLRATDWNIKEAVRTMLLADEFRYSTPRVRMPVELIAHGCKALNINADENVFPQFWLLAQRAGQEVFRPPNVSGWPYDKAWLSQTKTLARYDIAVQLFQKWSLKATAPASTDLAGWARLLGLAGLSQTTTTAVNGYLTARAAATEAVKQAAVFILIATSPDWQVM
ncbi:MAG: hypothetical protein QOE45_1374 [Frankiaceae bacterium]|nr:hypothetical protein [Frankiaceae bacterium]